MARVRTVLAALAATALVPVGLAVPAAAAACEVGVTGAVATPAAHTVAQLRVLLTVTARDHRTVTVALGELDPSFGNHLAVLTLDRGVDFVVPGDRSRARELHDVTGIRVAVSDAAARTTAPGSVQVAAAVDGRGRHRADAAPAGRRRRRQGRPLRLGRGRAAGHVTWFRTHSTSAARDVMPSRL
ncbi:hypothetical protein [Kutzneria buriramensis]|uniref:hypothetical protein n=1 Tax=Kutzneria buriramensis TaxID=1045776 RepID=UPI000E24D122|nr:hypothetical protein [Kutzneria buriramensis]